MPRATGRGRGQGRRSTRANSRTYPYTAAVEARDERPANSVLGLGSLAEIQERITTSVTASMSVLVRDAVTEQLSSLLARPQQEGDPGIVEDSRTQSTQSGANMIPDQPAVQLGVFDMQRGTGATAVGGGTPGLRSGVPSAAPAPDVTTQHEASSAEGVAPGLMPGIPSSTSISAGTSRGDVAAVIAGSSSTEVASKVNAPGVAGPGLRSGFASLGASPGTVFSAGMQQSINSLPICNPSNDSFVGGMGSLAPHFAPLPLDYAVPDQTKNAIWNNEYVEFGFLIHPTERAFMSLSVKGSELCLVQGNKKLPKSIEEWQTAFAIFSVVYTQKYPEQVAALLKYGETVKQLAAEGGDFNLYDTSFRKLRFRVPLAWDHFHAELYMRAMRVQNVRKGASCGGPTNRGPGGPPGRNGNTATTTQFPVGYCFRFHSGKQCDAGTCGYRHKCFKCQNSHPVFKCNQQKAGGFNGGNRQAPGSKQPEADTKRTQQTSGAGLGARTAQAQVGGANTSAR